MGRLKHMGTGTVRFEMTGGSPERFLNLCSFAGLSVWGVSCRDGVYTCSMKAGEFFQCDTLRRKAGVKLRILKKSGLSFFLFRNRKRKLWGLGFLAFFFLLFYLSCFIWEIEFQGNRRYTEDTLFHFLDSLHIQCGMKKNGFSCEELEAALREKYPQITWVSVRLRGTRLLIQIKENEIPVEHLDQEEIPCDLIADADAVITSMIVRKGVPAVRVGDRVTKGQLLVSGTIPILDDSGTETARHRVRADADVVGIRSRTERKEFSLWHSMAVPTGRERVGAAAVIGKYSFVWLLPSLRKTDWQTSVEYRSFFLPFREGIPISIGTVCSREVSISERPYGKEELMEMARAFQQETREKLMEKGVHIIENNVKILVNGLFCRLEANLKTEESITVMTQGEQQSDEHNRDNH